MPQIASLAVALPLNAGGALLVAAAFLHGYFALFFMLTALPKARDFMRFQGMVAAYRLVPNSLLAAVSGTVVGAELLAAIGLAVPVLAPAGAGLGALLCLIFGAAIGINLLLGRKDIDCGCEPGRNATPISWKAAARNLGFALLLGACAWLPLRIPLALWVQGLAGSVLLHVLLRAFTTIHAALAANNRRL